MQYTWYINDIKSFPTLFCTVADAYVNRPIDTSKYNYAFHSSIVLNIIIIIISIIIIIIVIVFIYVALFYSWALSADI